MVGGHWAVLQTVAWSKMLADRMEDRASLRQAVAETFDGEHPCPLCRAIVQGKQKQETDPALPDGVKKASKDVPKLIPVLSFVCAAPVSALSLRWPEEAEAGPLRSVSPPVPPPKRAA